MTIKFYVYNEVTEATITATSENLSFPLSNLKDDRRTKVYRSNTNNDAVLFDFGGFKPIDAFQIVGHSVNGFHLTKLTLQLNNTNLWTAPAVSIEIPLDYENNSATYEFPTASPYKFARLLLESTGGYCELSKVFIGKLSGYNYVDFSYPLSYQVNDLSTISKNRFGQRFIDEIASQKIIKGKIDNIGRDDIDAFLDFLSLVSNTRPFFINFANSQMSQNVNRFNGYYYLNSEPSFQLTSGNFWTVNLDLEEAN